jgi:hypothetical protein
VVLLGVNLVLFSVAAYLFLHSPEAAPGARALPLGGPTNEAQTATPLALSSTAVAPPLTVIQTNDFRWRQLESEDYRTYIARLRAIGCPEQTIRDLIIADVDSLIAPRLGSIAPRTNPLVFWQTDERELWSQERRARIREQRQDIDFEKRDIIWQLMGIDLAAERLRVQGEEDALGERLRFLPVDKQTQVRKLMDQYETAELALRERQAGSGLPLKPGDQTELRRLFQERDQRIAQLLTPAEFEQYELWFSPTAYKVRDGLFGMNPSQEEFLAVYALTRSFDETWNTDTLDLTDPDTRQHWEQARRDYDQQIREKLGEERYAEYKRGQDPTYRALVLAVARHNLPAQTANEAYQLLSLAQAEQARIRTSPTLSAQQKEAVLQEIDRETDQAAVNLLGPQAFGYYQQHGRVVDRPR